MAVARGRYTDLPDGAKTLTETQALKFQIQLIKTWPKLSDVFAVKYGMYLLSGATLLTGITFTNYFRKKFFLFHYGKLMSYFPISVIPACTCLFYHSEFILKDIVLRRNVCPTCLEVKAAGFQATIGAVFPALLAPVGCVTLSKYYSTYNFPSFTKEPHIAFKEIRKMFKPLHSKLWYIFLAQALCASTVTYLEMRSIETIDRELFTTDNEITWK